MPGKKDCSALILLLLVTGFFYYRFQGISLDGDNLLLLFPMYTLQKFPYFSSWGNYISSGSPLVYNIQNATAYPLRWIFYFLPEHPAFNLFTFLHHLLAFILTYAGLRLLKYSAAASLAGALLFGLSGGIQGKFINPVIFFAMIYLPFLIALTIHAFRQKTFSYSLLAIPILLGSIFNIGNVHTSLYAAIIVFIIFCVTLINQRFKNFTSLFLKLVFMGFFTFLVALPTLVSLVRMLPFSLRTTVTAQHIFDQQLQFREIIFSLLGGISTPENLDKTIFVGLAGVWPLIWGLKRFRLYSVYYILFLTGYLLALGQYGLYWFFQFIPVLDKIINPSRALMIPLAVLPFFLAAWLDNTKLKQRKSQKYFGTVIQVTSLILILTGIMISSNAGVFSHGISFIQALPLLPPYGFFFLSAGINLLGLSILYFFQNRKEAYLFILLLLLFNGWFFQFRYNYRTVPWDQFSPPSHIRYLQSAMANSSQYRVAGYNYTQLHGKDVFDRRIYHYGSPNLMQWYKLEGIQGLNPLMNKDYAQFFELFEARKKTRVDHELLILDSVPPLMMNLLSVRYIIGNPYCRTIASHTHTIQQGGELVVYDDIKTRPFKGTGIISAIDTPVNIRRGETIAQMVIETPEQTVTLPIRYLEESYDFRGVEIFERLHSRNSDLIIINKWPHNDPQRQWMGNYYAFFPFEETLNVQRITLQNSMSRGNFISYRIIGEYASNKWFSPHSEHPELYINPGAYPRFYVPDIIIQYPDIEFLQEWIQENQEQILENNIRIAFLHEKKGTDTNQPALPATSLELQVRGMDYYRLSGNFPEERLIATSIPFFPDWHLEINGKPAELFTVNTAFLGFYVPPGETDIVLRFRPVPWYISVWTAISGVLILLVLALFLRYERITVPGKQHND